MTIAEKDAVDSTPTPASAERARLRSDVDELAAKKTVRLRDDAAPDSRPAKRASRPAPLRVDEVGGAAMRIASRASSAPRLAKAAQNATKAPLDPQSAYVLSLVDGKLTVAELADISGFTRPQLEGILERLMRLGLVTKP